MTARRWNALARLLMAAALLLTGLPLARAWWPAGPLRARPMAKETQPQPGMIAVDARDHLSPADLQALNARFGLSLRHNSIHAAPEELLVSPVPQGQEEAILARLRRDPLVEAAERVNRYRMSWTPNDPKFSEQWHMKLVGAEKAWDRSQGEGVVVAVIDTGVAFENDDRCYRAKDFAGTRFVAGYDFVNDDAHPNDDQGHGTHVAGTVAETTNNGEGATGLAFKAKIMPLKVLDASGGGTSADIADAIRFAADNGAHVINMSLGGPYPDQVMRRACEYAAKKGVVIVCAAGNAMGGPVGYPAGFPECIAVSAVGPTGELAFYSSVGPEVAIAAPGGDRTRGDQYGVIQNTVEFDEATGERIGDGYFGFQGTSMASPHVAATAALAISSGVKDPVEVRALLLRAATPKGPAEKYGAGILSASKTVELASGDRRASAWKFWLSLLASLAVFSAGAVRGRLRGLTRFPFASLGFALGVLGPNFLFGWLGFVSPFGILLHSALIPLYLLWEAESRPVYRFVGALALGVALHLGWDAWHAYAPFPGIHPAHALPWLWVNTLVGMGVALVAWRRSHAVA